MSGATNPRVTAANTDNLDTVAEELTGVGDASAARRTYIARTRVTGIVFTSGTYSKTAGQTQATTLTWTPSDATIKTVTYESDTPSVATVNSSGVITAVAAGAKATGTLTSDGTNVTDGDTFTLNGRAYRFKDTTAAAYDVKIGASAAVTLDNLKAAVNASGTGDGTDYHTGTLIHPTVSATTNTNTVQTFEAKTAGTAGNALTLAEASTHLVVSGATLSGGTKSDATITATSTDGEFTATTVVTVS